MSSTTTQHEENGMKFTTIIFTLLSFFSDLFSILLLPIRFSYTIIRILVTFIDQKLYHHLLHKIHDKNINIRLKYEGEMDRILDKELEEKEKAVEDAIRGALSEQQTITTSTAKVNNNDNVVQPSEDSTIRVLDDDEYLKVDASPALTALLDNALYKTYEAELVPTVSSASQLLTEFINMKQTSALILRECQWMVGVPLSGGISIYKYNYDQHKEDIAVGSAVLNGVFLGEGAFINKKGEPHVKGTKIGNESMHTTEISNWNEYIVIQDFATQCYAAANEAIQKLSTDRLAESANLTLLDSLNVGNHDGGGESGSSGGGGGSHDTPTKSSPSNAASPAPLNLHNDTSSSSSSSYTTLADAGIGRCNHIQPRKNDCWESSRLYCPDYYWADETIGHCQRLLKSLSKHRFVTLVNSTHNGWDRYMNIKPPRKNKVPQGMGYTITAPTYASCTPHVFPSLEAIHALQYLVCELLPTSIPACLNKFRAGVEANAVVSKRLYLVKCEYRAPMRALWESYMNLNAAPKVGMVKGYLHDYHGMKNIWDKNSKGSKSDSSGGGNNSDSGGASSSSDKDKGKGSSGLRRQKSTDGKNKPDAKKPDAKKPTLKQKREELEKQITEKHWKNPNFVEALQLERCCERMEIEMSQMLLPLSNLAAEIMNEWKGRIRAVTLVDGTEDYPEGTLEPLKLKFGYEDVPFMRELLRRLKSILRRKPEGDEEATGIRPLLLDLQGVPRHRNGSAEASMNMSGYSPTSALSMEARLLEKGKLDEYKEGYCGPSKMDNKYTCLELFLFEVDKLLQLLNIPNMPMLVEERMGGSSKGRNALTDLVAQCNEIWDEEMFRAQYKDWLDMVLLQQELSEELSELSSDIRENEIELSLAMASKDQLERVHKRIEALRLDKKARYKVLAHTVFDIGWREFNEGIVVKPPRYYRTETEYPELSAPGVFGEQLEKVGEILPVG